MPEIRVRDPQQLWVIIHPQRKLFLGARWRQPHYSLMYSLGDFDTGYKCNSRDAAIQVLQVVKGTPRYSELKRKELRQLRVRRVRFRELIIDGDKP